MWNRHRLLRAWLRLKRMASGSRTAHAGSDDDQPLLAQLLSAEQMERHGKALARGHRVGTRPQSDLLLARLSDNQDVLAHACDMLNAASQAKRRLTPAGEWLLDNIYLIEEQISIARRHLPKDYSRELPKLVAGPSRGLPRVYDLALNAISHGDGRVDAESLSRFIAAYQTITPLNLGELWAFPIMLRLALIENLRRISARLIEDRVDRNVADLWADRLIETAESDPKNLVLIIADMARSRPPLASSFVAELARRLQGQSSALAFPLTWIEQWLADSDQTIEQMVQVENQQQAAAQVSVSNSIGSLRFLAMMDWREFVETMSAVEATLRRDPDGTYGRMDFATRDRYRHIVELTARRGKLPEHDVAMKVLELAQAQTQAQTQTQTHPSQESDPHENHSSEPNIAAHVGYYLVDDGRRELERALGVRGFSRSVRKTARRLPLLAYTVPGTVIVALFTWGILHDARPMLHPPALLWLIGFLCVIAFSELGVAVVNWVATLAVRPQALPRLDFSDGIPAEARTLVVVPSMFGDVESVEALAEALEVRYFANRHEHLHFALLTDFFDAEQQTLPQDAALLDAAQHQIDALNARHSPEDGNRFFLFHRPRVWNAREQTWMGEERKRGKLAALNAYLRCAGCTSAAEGRTPGSGRGGASDAFLRVAGNTEVLASVRYVITLDTDTQLPRDAAHELVATLAHPLNRARFDETRGVVTRGYGILQPRVGISMSGQRRSAYARLYGSEPGIDPYTRAVSDVYQDLFGEGSFVGKGIYDVDAFEHALAERMPGNRILSHDLLEGCYARAGLVSDIQLYEDYPSRYAVDVKRRHRWIRGDWQLLPWLLPRVPRLDARSERNPLSMLSRGKLLDNLRRSVVPASMTTLLVAGWLLSPQPLAWTLWLLAILVIPPTLATGMDLFKRPADMPLHAHLRHASMTAVRTFAHVPLTLACLAYEAFFSLDAIVRTLWRILVSRRHLLQWSPSSEVERTLGSGLAGSAGMMWFAPVFAIAVGVALLRMRPDALWVALPVLLLWFTSPLLMWWLSLTPARRDAELSAQQQRFLGKLSRRTWAFFETYVTGADHWLPPDNVQEHPALTVARRTSPTNIGLSLLADLSAYDFGYITVGGAIERTANTLRTLQTLPRHRGHFYNWYDTETLQPLPPRYVSSVDSGNLAGHLLTLRQGLLAFCDAPLLSPWTFQGLADTAALLVESRGDAPAGAALQAFHGALAAVIETPPSTLVVALSRLEELAGHARNVVQGNAGWTLADQHGDHGETGGPTPILDSLRGNDEPDFWADKLLAQCMSALEELLWFAPWLRSDSGAETPLLLQQGIPLLSDIADMLPPEDAEHALLEDITTAIERARQRIIDLERLADTARDCATMDYQFLYDRSRHLLSIGYNVDEQRVDQGYYDLLASEARLCSFVAIAQGQLPQDTWFALGRLLTEVDGDPTLLSWSGSMFEYLMPQLVMPSYEGTLLDQTSKHSVARQIEYGRQRNVPWGISESGYNIVDGRMNYQYRAFGVPGLGLKRGLAQDLVIAPYASMMALMTAPDAACENLRQMCEEGFSGRYGMYEAIDYTPSRLPRGQSHALIRSFMAHHQGMGLLSLLYVLRDQPMQKRFVADPEFQATLLLLQERIPRTGAFHPHAAEVAGTATVSPTIETELRIFRTPHTVRPGVQMLSNGRYHAMLSTSGGGYSRLREMAVTRWREDGTRDHWGNFCFLRDVQSGEFWSTTYQPCAVAVDHFEAIFSDAKAEFRGRKNGFEMHTEIAVSPEDDIELRRLRITNRSRTARSIEVTSYAEVVMAPAISDELHPAFSNLFVQTELVRSRQAIVCRRRPRAHDEATPSMFHLLAVHDADIDEISYETDRSRFIGRGNTLQRPDALTSARALSDSEGSVLDPIVSIRGRIILQPGQTTTIDMVSGVGTTREESTMLIDKYRDRRLADRVFDLAWTHSQVVRRQINATQSDAQLYERLAGLILYAHPAMRAEPSVLLQNRRGQSGLWGQAISGDHPIVLLQIADAANIELVRQLVQAHAYWRLKGLAVDLVIWNEDQAGYRQQLQDQIMGLIAAGVEANVLDRPGGIFVRPAQQLAHEDRILLQAAARVIISDARGKLSEQIGRRPPAVPVISLLAPTPTQYELMPATDNETTDARITHETHGMSAPDVEGADPWPFDAGAERNALLFDNGHGGFSPDGREYIVHLAAGQTTPTPWCNVIANANLGCVLSESSPGYTWAENAHEFRLTPWHNDPVSDTGGEAFYLRDEDTGKIWSPTPLPCRGEGDYRTRHGFGYSVYEHVEDGIASELWVYVAQQAAVKFSVLKLRNVSGRPRRITATGYVEWVLGDLHAKTQMHVVTEIDGDSNVLLAHNPYNSEFEGRVAFFDTDGFDSDAMDGAARTRGITGDRTEFLGRNGHPAQPDALSRERLSGKLGVGLDPCTAIQIPLDMEPGQASEAIFRLGVGHGWGDTVALARKMRGSQAAYDALDAVRMYWHRTLGAVHVETPEPGVDVLVNGWLMYQTIACRYLARSGYYQSGGAYGFRDQLQDTMAMVHVEPQRTRAHLLLSAAHQFPQGDVQHWWHPPLDRGVRTRCSDDYLWLPLATCRYVEATGDMGVLDEQVFYIEGRPVNPDEESYYDLTTRSSLRETLYQHCVRALERGLSALGERGLPLIATGDWNDGMNRVGEGGRGESVWLGFFLYDVLTQFSAVARNRNDPVFAERCIDAAERMRLNLEQHAWDGAWYRRAWFDNGAPLGSTASDECRIDSIAQSWSVLSGAGDPARTRQAMASLNEHLVRRDAGLVQLLDPPFDKTAQDPGYIRGYVPGVRENGGQYTHAAIWATMAFAALGDSDRAWELMHLINPVNHGRSTGDIAIYKVEPYVVAADVYAVAPHVGRGGWTWYTGSAGWMYRLAVESLLGLRREGDTLRLTPCFPEEWPEYIIRYRYRDTAYRIRVQHRAQSEARMTIDGVEQTGLVIQLRDDCGEHAVELWL